MAYGEPNFNFLRGGSTATSDATYHSLFGTYTGLSLLNTSDVVIVLVAASTGQGTLATTLNSLDLLSSQYFITPSGITETLPYVVGTASQMGLIRIGLNNPIVYWSIWTRNSL